MGADTNADAAPTSANGTNGKGSAPVVETALSPWILELILRFTLLDGATTFDPAALARRPLPLPGR
jgi:hypothetical protein